MRILKLTISGLLLALLLNAATTCSVYDASLVSGANTNPDASKATCALARWPDPPSSTNSGGDTEIITELTKFDFGEQYKDPDTGQIVPERRNIGYDLDGFCTTNENLNLPELRDPPGCEQLPGASAPNYGDLPGGRDNGLRNLIAQIAAFFPGFGTYVYNQTINDGTVSLLLDIKGYNEQADDDQVDVAVLTPGGALGHKPNFDGNDVWPVAAESFKGNDPKNGPSTASSNGYVKNHVLVGSFGDIKLRLRIGISRIEPTDLFITYTNTLFSGKLAKDNNGLWHILDGQIAARWKTDDLFAQVKYFPNPLRPDGGTDGGPGSTKLCTNTGVSYQVVRKLICDAADIYSGGASVKPPCDAVSVGIGFEAVQTKLGGVVPLDPPVNECGRYDAAKDTCTKTYQEQTEAGILP